MKNSTIFSIALILAWSHGAQAELTATQQQNRFNQANQAFRAGNSATDPDQQKQHYQQAILAYESLIQQGQIHNSKLYYNLGNAYLLQGDVGHAILNYRRAELLNDKDANLQKNLAFARSRRIDQFDTPTQQRVLETLFFWHYDFSIQTRFFLACLAFAVACIIGILLVWRGRSSGLLWILVPSLVIWLSLSLSVGWDYHQRQQTQHGVITDTSVLARQGDGANYPESFKEPLHAGTEFGLLEQRPGWFHILLPDQTDTWIPATAASIL